MYKLMLISSDLPIRLGVRTQLTPGNIVGEASVAGTFLLALRPDSEDDPP